MKKKYYMGFRIPKVGQILNRFCWNISSSTNLVFLKNLLHSMWQTYLSIQANDNFCCQIHNLQHYSKHFPFWFLGSKAHWPLFEQVCEMSKSCILNQTGTIVGNPFWTFLDFHDQRRDYFHNKPYFLHNKGASNLTCNLWKKFIKIHIYFPTCC